MMLENVLDTQNMVVGRQENFLLRLEVGFLSLSKRFFATVVTLKSGSEKSKIKKKRYSGNFEATQCFFRNFLCWCHLMTPFLKTCS